jgi:hypothetical protein
MRIGRHELGQRSKLHAWSYSFLEYHFSGRRPSMRDALSRRAYGLPTYRIILVRITYAPVGV